VHCNFFFTLEVRLKNSETLRGKVYFSQIKKKKRKKSWK